MAEQLGFQKFARNGGDIEGDERLGGARAVFVQGARHQLLASAGFAVDQHRDMRGGQPADGAKHLLHGRRLADDLRDAFRGCGRCGLVAPAVVDGAARQAHGVVHIERFRQIFERPAAIGGHRAFQIGMRGHDDDR